MAAFNEMCQSKYFYFHSKLVILSYLLSKDWTNELKIGKTPQL